MKRSEQKNRQLKFQPTIVALLVIGIIAAGNGAVTAQYSPKQQVGRQPDGKVVLPTNQVLHPAGQQVEFRGRPIAVTLSPDRKTAAFLNGAYRAIILVDPATGTIKQEFAAAGSSASFDGILYSSDGKTLYASQANGRLIIAKVADDGTLELDQLVTTLPKSTIPYSGREDGNPYPGGLALSEDGKTLYVVLSRNNTLAVFDLATRTVMGEIRVGNAPHAVIVSGNRAYVSNQGGRPAAPGDFTVDSSGTPVVAHEESGYATTGTVSVVDLDAGVESKAIEVGLHPTALLLDDRRLFVANSNSDTVSVIDVENDQVVKTINIKPFLGAPLGSSPNALAMMDGNHLVVSLGRNNALAVYNVPRRFSRAVEFEGLIPTAWYPSSIAIDGENRRLIVANGKGVGSLGPEGTVGPYPPTNKTGKFAGSNLGSTSIISFPTEAELRAYTLQVFENNNWINLVLGNLNQAQRKKVRPVPIPVELGDPSVFKHVFYIIKENRTYDQIFGALPQGNGDPNLVQFGREVTPNHHALAEGFVLFDNLYVSSSNSADGHQWITQAFVNDYLDKSYGGFIRTYPFNGGDSLAYSQTGFLWDNALKHGKSVRAYGEYVNGLRADGLEMGPWIDFLGNGVTTAGTWSDFYRDARILAGKEDGELHVDLEAHSDVPSLNKIINRDYPPYNMVIPDQYRVEVFLKEFNEYVKNGNLPDLTIMALTNDHTEGTKPTYPVPRSMVADNDLALGRVVEAISRSPYWKDSVIFVIEDDAQNGVDHVDGHRTIGFVISPYTKRQAVDSHYYTQIDFVRTIEQILGLPPMNQMDMAVEPTSMKHVFRNRPDRTRFKALPNQVPLDELNPQVSALKGLQKEWALASARMDFSKPDAADENMLNRVIWYSTKGFDKPYPGDSRVLVPQEVHAYLKTKQEKAKAGSKPQGE